MVIYRGGLLKGVGSKEQKSRSINATWLPASESLDSD